MRKFGFIKNNSLFALIFFVFTVFFLASCQSGKKQAVATIDGQTISGEYFLTTASKRFNEKSLDNRQKELKDFYHTVLRVYDAKQQGLDQKDELKYNIYIEQRRVKVQQLYNAYVLDKVITDDMIQEAYDHMDERRTVRHILIGDSTSTRSKADRSPEEAEQLAREIKQKIASGEHSFTGAAKEYSDGPSAEKGGDLGKINWGQMVQPFQVAAWKLKPNTISEPVRTEYGVHLIEVTDVDTVDLGTYEEARERIERNLQRSKRSEIQSRTQESLKEIQEKTGFSMDRQAIDSVAAQLYTAFQRTKSTDLQELVEHIHYVPVGELGGKPITLESFSEILNYIQHYRFRGIQSKSQLARRINAELQQEYLKDFAEDYGISDYKDTKYKIRWAEDQPLNEYYVENIVLKGFPPSEDTLRAYFDRVKFEKYSDPAEVHVQEIYFTEKQTAEDVRRQLDGGADFGELATEYTQRKSAQAEQGDLGWFQSNRYGPIGKKAMTIDKGSIAGPFQVGTGWSIIKLLDRKEGEAKSFQDIRNQVKQDYTDYYRPRRLEQNIINLEEKYNSELYYSYLDTI